VTLAFAAVAVIAFSTTSTGDYSYQVAPAMDALLRGNVGEFFRVQPVYGGFAVLGRLPFAAAARLGGGGELLVYQLGVLPCLVALALIGYALTRIMRRYGQAAGAQAVVGVLLLLNPVTIAAIRRGHPEELLTAALVVGATLAAIRSRPSLAGVLLGLALGTKQWALIGAIPILLACGSGRRMRAALIAGVIAAALVVPMAMADSGRFVTNTRAAQGGGAHASRLSLWWPVASTEQVKSNTPGGEVLTVRKLSRTWTFVARPVAVIVALMLTLVFWRRRRGLLPADTLGLLALLLLLRCLLDPLDNDYYHAPFLICLIAWEGLRVRGLPVLSLVAAAGLWATISSPWLSPAALGDQFYLVNNLFYLSWALLLGGWLALSLFGGRSTEGAAGSRLPATLRSTLTRAWIGEPQSSALQQGL